MTVDIPSMRTPTDVLYGLMGMLESEVTDARRAVHYLLNGIGEAQDYATLMLVHSTVVANYVFPTGGVDAKVKAQYPDRGKDLAALLRPKKKSFEALRNARDFMLHVDEKVERFFFDTVKRFEETGLGEPWVGYPSKWLSGEVRPSRAFFIWWQPSTETLTVQDHVIKVRELEAALDDLNERVAESVEQLIDVLLAPLTEDEN